MIEVVVWIFGLDGGEDDDISYQAQALASRHAYLVHPGEDVSMGNHS
jgi:hypothetical protein